MGPRLGPHFILLAEWTGFEPATTGVTGRYSNQLNYHSESWWVLRGSNPRPSPCKGDALPAELSTRKTCRKAITHSGRKALLQSRSNQSEATKTARKHAAFATPESKGALVYGNLQGLTSLEFGNIARRNMDRFTGSRVASRTCRTCVH